MAIGRHRPSEASNGNVPQAHSGLNRRILLFRLDPLIEAAPGSDVNKLREGIWKNIAINWFELGVRFTLDERCELSPSLRKGASAMHSPPLN